MVFAETKKFTSTNADVLYVPLDCPIFTDVEISPLVLRPISPPTLVSLASVAVFLTAKRALFLNVSPERVNSPVVYPTIPPT